MTEKVGAIVIGAGVVGLACARALALRNIETVVLEAGKTFGTGISSRNSEVVHAGIYYPGGSLKARFCVEGRRKLYDFCAARTIAYRRCGKLIVATEPEQAGELEMLLRRGQENGVDDLALLSAKQAIGLEPELHCSAALLSPSTGIIDSHGLMLALLADAEAKGAALAVNSPVTAGSVGGGLRLRVGGQEATEIRADMVINAAGLDAVGLASRMEGYDRSHLPAFRLAKGNYYSLAGRSPFTHLIYPVPEPGGLGVHLTLDLAGQARFGPDVEWVDAIDYTVDPSRARRFYGEVRRYWPRLADDALQPAYSGIRPKLNGPGAPPADFLIQGPEKHGIPGLVNLFGIESPGLTCCLAIADHVCRLLGLDPP